MVPLDKNNPDTAVMNNKGMVYRDTVDVAEVSDHHRHLQPQPNPYHPDSHDKKTIPGCLRIPHLLVLHLYTLDIILL
jgi:hypothetical protein